MSTVRSRHLTSGARRAALTACLLLAATGAAWLVRDLVVLGRPVEVRTGSLGAAPGVTARRAASVYDPVLAVGGLAAALAVRRGGAPALGALLSLAAATALLRLPLLWTADRPPGPDGTLTAGAQATRCSAMAAPGSPSPAAAARSGT
ncbi:hypothetical protein ACO0M4_01560 [Streptomyces sp. RGM 3693]|uniref:hypothetical protein n=1 Tax=Streptomyces sp. RGM 3693 TaxID=3413284 RepID=UPI003D2BFFF2